MQRPCRLLSALALLSLIACWPRPLLALEYPYAPFNQGKMDSQRTGWPLTEEEKTYVLKAEHERRPGREADQHVPPMWPVTPSAGFWGGTNWLDTHANLVRTAQASRGPIDILLVGDSITMQWGAAWQKHFGKYKTVNIGIGGDKTQNVLWRLDHGGVEGLEPRLVVLLIGNNNMFFTPETGVEPVAQGIKVCADNLREKFPQAPVIVVKVLPAHAPGNPFYEDIKKVNAALDRLNLEADPKVRVLDIWQEMVNGGGTLKKELFSPDNIHLTQEGGYELYARRLKSLVEALLAGKHSDSPKPSLWAMYYAWYETATGPHGRWRMWSEDQTATPNPQPKSQAQPLAGYYDSDDPEIVRWHIRLAKAAGIDAFLVSWWGGANISGAAFEKTIFPVAAEEKFPVAICSELAQFHHNLKQLARQTADVLRRVQNSPAYLHRDGKPVVYLYQVPFDPKLTRETLAELCRDVEAEVGPVYWIMDKVANPGNRGLDFPAEWLALPQIPMFGFYGTFSVKRIWKYEDLAPHYARLVRQAHAAGKQVFLPVHPGHDNSGFRPNDFFVIPRDAGQTLRGYLRAATEAGADAILVTSFNEWPETTVVEPSSSWPDPYQYLKILADWKGISFAPPPSYKPATKEKVH